MEEIIEQVIIYKKDGKINVRVENAKVFFLMGGTTKKIELYDYYEKKQGEGRYILATYLKHLLDEKYINCNTVVDVNGPTNLWGGAKNMDELVKIYIDHGFKQYNAEAGKPVVLRSTVGKVLQTLQGAEKSVLYTLKM